MCALGCLGSSLINEGNLVRKHLNVVVVKLAETATSFMAASQISLADSAFSSLEMIADSLNATVTDLISDNMAKIYHGLFRILHRDQESGDQLFYAFARLFYGCSNASQQLDQTIEEAVSMVMPFVVEEVFMPANLCKYQPSPCLCLCACKRCQWKAFVS